MSAFSINVNWFQCCTGRDNKHSHADTNTQVGATKLFACFESDLMFHFLMHKISCACRAQRSSPVQMHGNSFRQNHNIASAFDTFIQQSAASPGSMTKSTLEASQVTKTKTIDDCSVALMSAYLFLSNFWHETSYVLMVSVLFTHVVIMSQQYIVYVILCP